MVDEGGEAKKIAENRTVTELAFILSYHQTVKWGSKSTQVVQSGTSCSGNQTSSDHASIGFGGQLAQQYQTVVAPTVATGYHQRVNIINLVAILFHLASLFCQSRLIVMTVVGPHGVSGRPGEELRVGDLRNTYFMKGYMTSKISKKVVMDTLGGKPNVK